jgi:hypothetical protein
MFPCFYIENSLVLVADVSFFLIWSGNLANDIPEQTFLLFFLSVFPSCLAFLAFLPFLLLLIHTCLPFRSSDLSFLSLLSPLHIFSLSGLPIFLSGIILLSLSPYFSLLSFLPVFPSSHPPVFPSCLSFLSFLPVLSALYVPDIPSFHPFISVCLFTASSSFA